VAGQPVHSALSGLELGKSFFKIGLVIAKTIKFYQQTKKRKTQMAVKENGNEVWNLFKKEVS
jgi:hypothetical protein